MSIATRLPPLTRRYRVNPEVSPEWAALSSSSGTLFHSPEWIKVIRETYGFAFSAVIVERQNQAVAGVAWSDLDDLLGQRRVTLPFSDFCDPLGEAGDLRYEAVAAAMPTARRWLLRTRARSAPDVPAGSAVVKNYKWHVIEIDGGPEVVWSRFAPVCKRSCRKAERSGLSTFAATSEDELRQWFELHVRLRKNKHQLLAQPWHFFKSIWDQFIERDKGFLLLASHDGKVVAGTIFLEYSDTCYYKFNASDPNYLKLRPNNLLVWEGIRAAQRRGMRNLDLGRSGAAATGLIAFKRGFGAREEDVLAISYHDEIDHQRSVQGAAELLSDLTNMLTASSIPDAVTEAAGDRLYRYFA